MTNEERDLISKFVARVGGTPQSGFSRAVPATGPALPPIDPEADRFIAQQFQAYPEARYRVMQMAVVQEAALAEAGSRIQQLQQALQQAQQQQAAAAPPPSKGFLGGLFGGGAAAPQPQQSSPWNQGAPQQQQYAPQPPPQYAPNYPPNTQPGMFQQGGSGFLGSALSTAAGVAGGVVGANLLMGMFSGHSGGGMFGGGGGGGFGGGGFGGGMPQETIINNYEAPAVADQSGGGWDNNVQSAPDPGWDAPAPDSGGWDDNSGGGGGWDDNSNT